MLRYLRLGVLAVFLAAFATQALAQPAQTGTIAGEVRDASGAVLPGATITITSQERGFVRSSISDETGRYVFAAVSIGNYTVDATLPGFAPLRLTDNLVETEKTTTVPIVLRVGGLTDTVTVTGETPIVDITNATANVRIRREEFERLPIGRSYQTLSAMTPGVVGGIVTGNSNVNALGSPQGGNLFVVDSVDTTDPTTGTFGTNLNFEAIQEVSISTSATSVEYGRAQGAIVSVITKAGTNRFEGSAKYIAINDTWDDQNTTENEITGAVAGAGQVRQGQPGLHLHARRPGVAGSRLVLRRLRVLDQHHARSARPPGRLPRTTSSRPRTTSSTSAGRCSSPRTTRCG